jgi:hypothetical protein
MKDLFEGLHALVNIQTIVAFLLLVVPGSIALRTYDRRRARQARKLNESIVDIVVVSFICDALWSAALSPTRVDLEIGKPISVTTSLIAVAALIATPILLAIAFVFLEDLLANAGSVSDPEPQPWDKWFQRVKRDKTQMGVLLVMKSDRRAIGGMYVDPGFASTSPADQSIHIGQTWDIEPETGRFKRPVKGTLGIYVQLSEVETVEFFQWSFIESNADKENPPHASSEQSPS